LAKKVNGSATQSNWFVPHTTPLPGNVALGSGDAAE
jgi:hypothetical protein